MNSQAISRERLTVIEAKEGWRLLDLKELKDYRDLLYFLVWRDIKVLYAQTVLGFSWAILNPVIQIIIFTIIFGRVAKVSTGGIPYVLFASAAIIPWTYISNALTQSGTSLILNQNMLGKIYFPRLLYPLTPILSKMVDFIVSLIALFGIMAWHKVMPTWNMLLLPVFILFMMIFPAALGMLFSAMAIRFRDVKFAMPFIIRMLMYSAPVVYSAGSISPKYRLIYSLNPLVGVIEGFRSCILGTPFEWQYIAPSMASGIILLVVGALYFRKIERVFVDVI